MSRDRLILCYNFSEKYHFNLIEWLTTIEQLEVAKYGLKSVTTFKVSAAFLCPFCGIYSTLSCVDEDINNLSIGGKPK